MTKTQQEPSKYLSVHQNPDAGSLILTCFTLLEERLPNSPKFVIALRCGQLSIRIEEAMPKLFLLGMT